jgi:hypothetical protein
MDKPQLMQEEAPEAPAQDAIGQMIDQVIGLIQSGDSEGAIAALQQMKGEQAQEESSEGAPEAVPEPSKRDKMMAALEKMGR